MWQQADHGSTVSYLLDSSCAHKSYRPHEESKLAVHSPIHAKLRRQRTALLRVLAFFASLTRLTTFAKWGGMTSSCNAYTLTLTDLNQLAIPAAISLPLA